MSAPTPDRSLRADLRRAPGSAFDLVQDPLVVPALSAELGFEVPVERRRRGECVAVSSPVMEVES